VLEIVVGDEVLRSPENYFSKVFTCCLSVVGCSALHSGDISKEVFQQHCGNQSAYLQLSAMLFNGQSVSL